MYMCFLEFEFFQICTEASASRTTSTIISRQVVVVGLVAVVVVVVVVGVAVVLVVLVVQVVFNTVGSACNVTVRLEYHKQLTIYKSNKSYNNLKQSIVYRD